MSSSEAANATKAIVYEFTCLFTHDLKRKQKRWQDGKLKYHTFNGKVMVYDDRGNYVGESRWQEEEELADGDEFPLDRGGAIVQVAECTGSHEQNLADLVDKRAKEVQQRRVEKAARQGGRSGFTTPQSSLAGPPRAVVGHRPLNTLIASPARIGRAVVPTKSPYEVRNVARLSENEGDTPPSGPSKRKRGVSPPSKQGHARALFGTQLSFANPSRIAQARRQILSQRQANNTSSVSLLQAEAAKASQESPVESAPSHSPDAEQAEEDRGPDEPSARAKRRSAPPVKLTENHTLKAQQRSSPQDSPGQGRPSAISPGEIAPEGHKDYWPTLVEHKSDDESLREPIAVERKEHKRPRDQEHELERQQHSREEKRPRQREERAKTLEMIANVEIVDLDDEEQPRPASRATPNAGFRQPESLPLVEDESQCLSKPRPNLTKRKALLSTVGRSCPDATVFKAQEDVNVTSQQLTNADLDTETLQHGSNGPRTVLRIGSRKKRGLLMMSERKLVGAPRPRPSTSDSRLDRTRPSLLSDGDAGASREVTKARFKPQSGGANTDECPEEQSSTGRRAQKTKQAVEALGEEDLLFQQSLPSSSDNDAEPEPRMSPRLISRRDEENLENSKKPRIAPLARKSVRSREIFGYVPEDAAPTIAFSAAAPQSKVFEEARARTDADAATAEFVKNAVSPPQLYAEHPVDDDVPSDPDEMLGNALEEPKKVSGEAGVMLNSQVADAAFEQWLAQMSSPPDAPEVNGEMGDGVETPTDVLKKASGVTTAAFLDDSLEGKIPELVQSDLTLDVNGAPPKDQHHSSASSTIPVKDDCRPSADAEDGHMTLCEATARSTAEEANHKSNEENDVTIKTLAHNGAQDTKTFKAKGRCTITPGQFEPFPELTQAREDISRMVREDTQRPVEKSTLQPVKEALPQVVKVDKPQLAEQRTSLPTMNSTTAPEKLTIAQVADHDANGTALRDADVRSQDAESKEVSDSKKSPSAPTLGTTNAPNVLDEQCVPEQTTTSSPGSFKALLRTEMTTAAESPAERGRAAEVMLVSDGQALEVAPTVPEPQPDLSNGGKPRILVNPATRGKKAASKAHAAGPAPRSLIQLDPPSLAPPPRRRVPAVPLPRKTSNAGPLPAFEKASGGAWSAHAGDLLGISHPRPQTK